MAFSEEARREHRSAVVASVVTSAGFVEAVVNEAFAAAGQSDLEMTGRLPADERDALTSTAEMLSSRPALDRYQLALQLLRRPRFDPGTQPYQSASLLMSVRNELVHFKPRWRDAGNASPGKGLESRLAHVSFGLNPFTGAGNPFFPDKALSAGLAAWGWNAALAFVDEFCSRLAVTAPYMSQRSLLTV